MKKVHVIAHTHWDFEWYFTRQNAQIQFAYHMDEVFRALEQNRLDYYLLDGQMSIIDDYLNAQPDKRELLVKFVKAKRLYIGPWYTQIDEMVTSGEAIVRNLQLGHKLASDLGGVTKLGYLPDSFGQGQDMPKIYNGFDITATVFWRGMPKEKNARYFYWTCEDGSKVLAANIKNGYYAGIELVESDDFNALLTKISTDTDVDDLVVPVGGDQRPVDFNLKQRLALANASQNDYQLVESTYPQYFEQLAKNQDLPIYSGEFVDPSASKIHRGIYSSRVDLKCIYDELERVMTYVVEPLMTMAQYHGIEQKFGIVDEIWKTIVRGQAHDSSGGCNSDETNKDIFNRAVNALQLANSLRDYLLRKLSSKVPADLDLFFWNPQPVAQKQVLTFKVNTRSETFKLSDVHGKEVVFEVLQQEKIDAAVTRRDVSQMVADIFYETTIALETTLPATDWIGFKVVQEPTQMLTRQNATLIENEFYTINYTNGGLELFDKATNQVYADFLNFEDGGDEGDTYDYSPAFEDWILTLDLKNVSVQALAGKFSSQLTINGSWQLPYDLKQRAAKVAQTKVDYCLHLTLNKGDKTIGFEFEIDNTVLDHRLRLVLNTNVLAKFSYADTPFGTIKRPVMDMHLNDWQEIGYHEEPTAMRPMIHFANVHDDVKSWSFIGLGQKDFEVIGEKFDKLAITMLRGVGFLGRPDTKRRPGDASGLQTKYVPTPDSQLNGVHTFKGGICLDESYMPTILQARHRQLAVGTLGYQNQAVNRFTTPIQYFMINENPTALQHYPLCEVKATGLVISSFSVTSDYSGLVIRLYNPSKEMLKNPGHLQLAQTSNVSALNLNHEVRKNLATEVECFELPDFAPGEIQTYGIYPLG